VAVAVYAVPAVAVAEKEAVLQPNVLTEAVLPFDASSLLQDIIRPETTQMTEKSSKGDFII
jgi:hypothetical protein